MTQFIIFLIIGVVGIVVGYYLGVGRRMAGQGVYPEETRGAVGRRQAEKDANISKLKEYLSGKETVTNDEIAQRVDVRLAHGGGDAVKSRRF